MKPFVYTAVMFVLCCARASAGDFLEPETNMTNPADAYYAGVLADIYREAYAPLVVGRMIAEPWKRGPYAVGLRGDYGYGGYFIFTLTPSFDPVVYRHIKNIEQQLVLNPDNTFETQEIEKYKREAPKDPKSITVAKCEIAIDKELGVKLESVWQKMLALTRHTELGKAPEGTVLVSVDGESFHFSSKDLAGYTGDESSSRGGGRTNAGRLVTITDTMREICDGKNLSL